MGALNQSWSSLFAQPVTEVAVPGIGLVPIGGFGPEVSLVGRGATYSSVFYRKPSRPAISLRRTGRLEVSSGVPLWLTVKITGFSPTPPFSGTVLGKLLPGVVPITAVYHFTQFGAIQPYLGAGIVPTFEFAVQDGFNTGGWFRAHGWSRCSGWLRLHVQPKLGRLLRREEALHLVDRHVGRIRSRSADRYDSRGRHDQDNDPTVVVLNGCHVSLLSPSRSAQPPTIAWRSLR